MRQNISGQLSVAHSYHKIKDNYPYAELSLKSSFAECKGRPGSPIIEMMFFSGSWEKTSGLCV